MKKILVFLFTLNLFISWNCESEKPVKSNRVVIGAAADVENLNPLYAFGLLEGNIRELLFLSLVKHKWVDETGDLETEPFLAEKWEWNQDSSSVVFYLRDNIFWSDNSKLTAEDVVYSFDLYSDAEVSSTFYGGFENFYTDQNLQIDLNKTFEIISPTKIKINFKPGSKPNLFDVDMPILPKKVFSKISRKDLNKTNIEDRLITNGPYSITQWKKNEMIILRAVENSVVYEDNMVKELVFKIVPDENSRITQLKNGEIDLIEDINVEAISELKKADNIRIVTRTGRDFDYVGWNNIDPELYSKHKGINPNKFFGSPNVRKALSYSINRQEILTEYLQNFGKLSFGPVSPIFKAYFNNDLQPHEYNPVKAKEILAAEGWIDRDQNGIIEKNNNEFSFALYIGAGNPRRNYAATVVKNNLKAVGIEVKIETMEMSAFINKLFARELNAWMAGWTISIPIDMQPYWHSDFNKSPFNLPGFNNSEVNKILVSLEVERSKEKKAILYKKLQELLHEYEPVTFLYWLDIKTAFNSRIEKIRIDPLGAMQHCWEWRIKE
jgi:peptide/nickel transport system substrate-binding protein